MMTSQLPLILLALSTVLAAPQTFNDDYTQVIIPQKRAALVLDRLLVALQKALHEDGTPRYVRPDRDGPRTAPLRIASLDDNDMMALSEEGGAPATWRSRQDSEPRLAPLRLASIEDETQVIIPQKRAALVLDRLLVALQKALHEDGTPRYVRPDRDGPRTAPLRIASLDDNDMMALSEEGGAPATWRSRQDSEPRLAPLRLASIEDETSALQRRTGTGRGRVLRCYFNAVTCF